MVKKVTNPDELEEIEEEIETYIDLEPLDPPKVPLSYSKLHRRFTISRLRDKK